MSEIVKSKSLKYVCRENTRIKGEEDGANDVLNIVAENIVEYKRIKTVMNLQSLLLHEEKLIQKGINSKYENEINNVFGLSTTKVADVINSEPCNIENGIVCKVHSDLVCSVKLIVK